MTSKASHARAGVLVITLLVITIGTVAVVAPASASSQTTNPVAIDENLTTGTYTGLSMASDGRDVYAVRLAKGESINLTTVTSSSAPFSVEMEVLDPQGSRVQTSSFVGAQGSQDTTDENRLTYEARTDGVHLIVARPRATQYVTPPQGTRTDYTLRYGTDTDRFEPDGTLGTAASPGPGTYSGLTLLSGEDDVFAIDLQKGESVNVTVESKADAPFSTELELRDPQGRRVETGSYNGPQGSLDETVETRLTYEAEKTGTHYFVVEPLNTQYVSAPPNDHIRYDLRYGTDTDRYEPNGALKTAASPGPGRYSELTLLSSEDDVFAVDLQKGESVNVTVESKADAPFSTELELRDPQGRRVETGSYNGPQGSLDETVETRLTYEAEKTGTHYFVVEPLNTQYVSAPPNDHIRYDLRYQTETDPFEPNGVLTSATPLGPYDDVTLLSGEKDVYAVNLSAGRTLDTIAVSLADAPFATEMELRDPQGSLVERGTYNGPQGSLDETVETNLTYEASETGTHYLVVKPLRTQYVSPPPNDHIRYDLTATPVAEGPPIAAFSVSNTTVVAGGSVTVDAAASADPDGTIQSYEWTFGDGSTASGPTATRSYSSPGLYNITLTVTDDDGSTQSTTRTVKVAPSQTGGNPTLPGSSAPAQDVDGDTLLEDIDGDGQTDTSDVLTYYDNRQSEAVRDNPSVFDFDGDGVSGTVADALALYDEIS